MRVVKEAAVRREEILKTAVRLFASHGYNATSIEDILAAEKIAKGTFYYYFKTKEELLDAAIDTYIARMAEDLQQIVKSEGAGTLEKFISVITKASDPSSDFKRDIMAAIHQPGNELLHQKSLVVSVLTLVPILTDLVCTGKSEGVFKTRYPQVTVEALLFAAQFMFDEQIFPEDSASPERLKQFLAVAEEMLGAADGSFDQLLNILKETQE